MVAVIAKLRVKQGKVDDVIQAFRDFLPAVEKEEGTLYYTLNRDRNDPNLLVVIERYRDEAAFQAHSTTPEIAKLFEKAQPLLEGGMELSILDEVASI